MAQSYNILEELKELDSSLAAQPVQAPFEVPAGYFESLLVEVMAKIRSLPQSTDEELTNLSPLLAAIPKDMPYAVPHGYFQSVDINLGAITTNNQSPKEEIERLSPLLGGIKREMPFAVPQGYFNSIRSKNDQSAKVVGMPARNWLKYAVAAIFIGIIATTVVLISNGEKVDPDTNSYSWVQKKMKKVSTDEIENFVELSDEVLPHNEIVANNAKNNEVKELIKDIPINEIEAFLTDIPQEENNPEDDGLLN